MRDPHAADADYRDLNGPDEAALARMLDSAVELGAILEGQGRRRVDAEGRGRPHFAPVVVGTYEEASPPIEDAPEPPTGHLRPRYDTDGLAAAMAAAWALPPRVTPDEAATMSSAIDAITRQVGALRLLGSADPVVGHALNSIDLGLVGLARAVGNGDPPG